VDACREPCLLQVGSAEDRDGHRHRAGRIQERPEPCSRAGALGAPEGAEGHNDAFDAPGIGGQGGEATLIERLERKQPRGPDPLPERRRSDD